MNATTHAIFGVAALSGTALLSGMEPPVYAYPLAVAAAWLPDVDNPRSRLGNGLSRKKSPVLNTVTRPLSWALRTTSYFLVRTVGHRTLTHSILGVAVFLLPIWLLLGSFPSAVMAIAAGCISHLVADALNTPGVPLLWPLGRRFRLLPGGIRSGGVPEFAVAALVFVLAVWTTVEVHPGLGTLL